MSHDLTTGQRRVLHAIGVNSLDLLKPFMSRRQLGDIINALRARGLVDLDRGGARWVLTEAGKGAFAAREAP